jgi:serine/threonine-protein kinase
MVAGLLLSGRYQLVEKLGAGGMGSVWRAQDLTLNADVAIKLLEPEFVASPEAVYRFRREAQAAAAIRSTHVVQIFDYGIEDDKPYIAMELLKGEDLEKRLARVGSLGLEVTARVLGQIARAIALAHDHGIIHRDLKPGNIFLAREYDDEVTKVLDFGIARKPEALAEGAGLLTKTGMILGTPYYMSPEQAGGQAVDELTDIWSFGIIACECITGRRVFQSETLGSLFHAVCIAAMPVPSQMGSVPDDFDAWFSRACARDKSQRFQSMREAADSLKLLVGRSSGSHRLNHDSATHEQVAPVSHAGVPQPTNPGLVEPAAVPSGPDELELTAPPSSHSIRRSANPTRNAKSIVAAALVALIVGGLIVGWRWIHASSSTQAIATGSTIASAPLPNGEVARTAIHGTVVTVAPVAAVPAGPLALQSQSDPKLAVTNKGQQRKLHATPPSTGERTPTPGIVSAPPSHPNPTPTTFVGSKVDPRIGL